MGSQISNHRHYSNDSDQVNWFHFLLHCFYNKNELSSQLLEELNVCLEEILEQHQALEETHYQLALERQHYQELFELAPDGYLTTDLKGIVTSGNRAAHELLNVPSYGLLGKPLGLFIAQSQSPNFYTFLEKLRNQLSSEQTIISRQFQLKPRHEEPITANLKISPIKDSQNKIVGWRWLLHDITPLEVVKAQLYRESRYDSLTNLPNRQLLLEFLENRLKLYQSDKNRQFALLFLDLDRFKQINDSLGHFVGDGILISVARRLQNCVRDRDTVARLSGDEFVILIEHIHNPQEAQDCAQRIQQALTQPFIIQNHRLNIGVSIGIVIGDGTETDASNLVRHADIAMYQVKYDGGGDYSVFNPQMHSEVLQSLQLRQELSEAVNKQQFRLHYQKIISLIDNQVTGFEVLLRWEHPQKGILPPQHFLEMAEKTGLIIPIGWATLRQACLRFKQLQNQFASLNSPLVLNFNLSHRQFIQPNLVGQIATILKDTSLDPSCLQLEITENVILEHLDGADRILNELKNLGVKIAIDDFGTGFSSLSRLIQFSIDTLKIDRSFVSEMETNPNILTVIKLIINLAHQLNIEVIAEGIESPSQAEKLRSLHCDYGQGYLYDDLISADDFLKAI